MIKVSTILTAGLLLASCQGSKISGQAKVKSISAPVVNSPIGASPPSTSDGSPSTPSTNPPGSTTVGAPTGSEDVQVDPALPPSILAGATLTCGLIKSKTVLQCDTQQNGKNIDLKPVATYVAVGDGIRVNWTPIAMEVMDVGRYVTPATAEMSAQFIIGFKYGANGSSFITDLVGSGNLPFLDRVVNGGFENYNFTTGSQDYLSAQIPAPSSWVISSNDSTNCPGSDAVLRIQTASATGPSYPAADGTKWASLDSRCANDEAMARLGGSYTLKQQLTLQQGNYYHIQFEVRIDEASKLDPNDAQLVAQWGEIATTVREIKAAGTTWQKHSFNVVAKSPNVWLVFKENGLGNHQGTMLDSVKVLDLGLKP